MMTAVAYYNFGRWVADCPADGCHDARALFPEDGHGLPALAPVFDQVCMSGHAFRIVAPPDRQRQQIEQVLAERPLPQDRSWLPDGHPWAAHGYPTGQSVEELRRESQEVASFRAAQGEAKRTRLIEILSGLGVEVRPDGSFAGQIGGL